MAKSGKTTATGYALSDVMRLVSVLFAVEHTLS